MVLKNYVVLFFLLLFLPNAINGLYIGAIGHSSYNYERQLEKIDFFKNQLRPVDCCQYVTYQKYDHNHQQSRTDNHVESIICKIKKWWTLLWAANEQEKIKEYSRLPEYEIYQKATGYDTEYNARIEGRRQAVQIIKIGKSVIYKQSYTVSQPVKTYIQTHNIDGCIYYQCMGDQLQHVLHQEYLQLRELSSAYANDWNSYDNNVVALLDDVIDIGFLANRAGFLQKAIELSDACWLICKGLIIATGKGIIKGAVNAVPAAVLSAGIVAVCPKVAIALGIASAVYITGKVSYEVGSLAGSYLFGSGKTAHEKINGYYQSLRTICDELSKNRGMKGPEKIVFNGAAYITEIFITNRLSRSCGIYFKKIRDKALSFVKNYANKKLECDILAAGIKEFKIPTKSVKYLHALHGESKATNYARNIIKVANMNEFFTKTEFGKMLKEYCAKTGKQVKGQSVYVMTKKTNLNQFLLDKGDYFYLDSLHFDHLEVFNKTKKFKLILNLDGTYNYKKTALTINRGRIIHD